VARKFIWAAQWARERHLEELAASTTPIHIQFDEMESFEHTRLKPLSISLAVRTDTAKILDIQVGTLNYKGRLANFAFSKYGPRVDTSEKASLKVLENLKLAKVKDSTFVTDAKNTYPKLIKETFPQASHVAVKVEKVSMAQRLFRKGRRNINDPLFVLNLTSAKIRHDLSRMARKVWVTTKRDVYLQAHLDLYIAYANGYKLPA